jgi:hypothetical protein
MNDADDVPDYDALRNQIKESLVELNKLMFDERIDFNDRYHRHCVGVSLMAMSQVLIQDSGDLEQIAGANHPVLELLYSIKFFENSIQKENRDEKG